MIEKLKSTTDKEELKKLLTQFLDTTTSTSHTDFDELESVREYVQTRPDLLEILKDLKKENKTSLKSVLAKIDEYNKEYHPELVPKDPNSLKERIELQKKFKG